MTTQLYNQHVEERRQRSTEILQETGYDGLVLSSGTAFRYFADDMHAPFHTNPHFAHWAPLPGPGHLLLVTKSDKPRLIRFAPDDYWYEQAPLDRDRWGQWFDIEELGSMEDCFDRLPSGQKLGFVGDATGLASKKGFGEADLNPEKLLRRLDWDRSLKTDYEIECTRQATVIAARGHRAAKECFENGGSELDIHHAYVQAAGCVDPDLPYNSIVALNERGAILHYEGKRTDGDGMVLLIDVGASHGGYASDITRTWTRSSADPVFVEMVNHFDALQKDLCQQVRPGLSYPDLHHAAHVAIGDLLYQFGVLKVPGEEAVEKQLTRTFFPHGLGHFLGIQVHDVGGHQKDPSGGTNPPHELHPYLRTTRTIEERMIFTVEPGLYFIDLLLDPQREGDHRDSFDWSLIDRLKPHGGIRIEDNVVVTADGHRNLTREELP